MRLALIASIAAVTATGLGASAQAPASVPPANTLPVTRTEGDLSLTFTELKVMPPPPGPPSDDPNEASWTRASFRFEWGGRSMREWAFRSITVTDASGRTYSPSRTSSYLSKGEGHISFNGPVWPTAQPWKLRFELARTSPIQSYEFWNTYQPDEILTVRSLTVPAPGRVFELGQTAEAQGARVQLIGIAGANAQLEGGLPFKYTHPSLHWRVERPKDVHVTFLRATNAAGEVIKPQASAEGQGRQGERYARELIVPNGVREIFVAFGVHKSRYFEFTAVPKAE